MNYLVTNIKFNGGKPYRQQMPKIYEPIGMVEAYLRSTIFDFHEVEYDFMPLPYKQWATTHYYLQWQPFDVQLTRFKCDDDDSWFTVWPMHNSSIFVVVSDVDMENASNDLKHAIYDKLYKLLSIHFVYRRD